jgi:hypothetical protein
MRKRVMVSVVLGAVMILGAIATPAQAGKARSNAGKVTHGAKVQAVKPHSIASFKAFATPVAKYVSKTCVIDLSAIADGTSLTSVSGCGVTVSFSSPMTKYSVPATWATWGSPPDTESASPNVLWSEFATSITLTTSNKNRRIGIEAEPNPFSVHTMSATFRKGNGNAIGSVTRDVDGSGGARLFAGKVGTPKKQWIKYVDVASDVDFAIAQIRVS